MPLFSWQLFEGMTIKNHKKMIINRTLHPPKKEAVSLRVSDARGVTYVFRADQLNFLPTLAEGKAGDLQESLL